MEWYWILLIALGGTILLLLVVIFGTAFGLATYLSCPKHYSSEHCQKVDIEKGLFDLSLLEKWESRDFVLRDGYKIHGDYIPAEDSKGLIIFVHGYTWSMEGDLKYVTMTRPLGYDSYIYDVRGHGHNKRVPSTMGHKEAMDLLEIIRAFRKERGPDAVIGLHGESMGAATVLEVMKYGEKIDFIIEDSGYSTLKTELEFQLRNFPPLKALLPLCSKMLKLFYGYRIEDVNALEAAKDFHGPLLIMHGAADTFVPTFCAEEIEKAHMGRVERHMFPDCDHTLAAGRLNKEYTEILQSFLKSLAAEKQDNQQ